MPIIDFAQNKAQDKWPFFDSSWKKMSTTTVRNNARGVDASGVSLPSMTSATRDSAMSNEQDAPKGERYNMSWYPELFVLTSTGDIRATTPGLSASSARSLRQTRRKAQSSAEPSTGAPTTLPTVKKESSASTLPAVKKESHGSLPFKGFKGSQAEKSEPKHSPTAPTLVPVRRHEPPKMVTADVPLAARGKKRGRNGRYLTKEDDHVFDDGEHKKPVKKGQCTLRFDCHLFA